MLLFRGRASVEITATAQNNDDQFYYVKRFYDCAMIMNCVGAENKQSSLEYSGIKKYRRYECVLLVYIS